MSEAQTMPSTYILGKDMETLDSSEDCRIIVFDSYDAFDSWQPPNDRRGGPLHGKEYLIIDTRLHDDGIDNPVMTIELMRVTDQGYENCETEPPSVGVNHIPTSLRDRRENNE